MVWKAKPSSSTFLGQSVRGMRASRFIPLAAGRMRRRAEAAAARARGGAADGAAAGRVAPRASHSGSGRVRRSVEIPAAAGLVLGGGRAGLRFVAPVGQAILTRLFPVPPR